ncbi:uncharacterized protein [Halyomorpha halys]|uniref:uncharacterized protein n=1 Tax=Halyomorpha halys TaxID=286706 RepID=UPI0034D36F26
MDDLKLYAKNKQQLQSMSEIVSSYTKDISISFGLDKCVVLHVNKGKVVSAQNLLINEDECIRELEAKEQYNYLGIQQHLKIARKDVKQELITMLEMRLRKILKTQLSGKHKIKIINTWVIPALSYSFGILQWSNTSLPEIARLVKTTLTQERVHHPISSKSRLYLSRKEGGRGLINIEEACNKQELSLRQYFHSKITSVYQAIVTMDHGLTALNLSKADELNIVSEKERLAELKSKSLHGRFYSQLNEASIDKERSVEWLTARRLFSETEGFVVAIQDQVIATRSYRNHVLKDATASDKCRLCSVALESIQHITGGCGLLAGTEYLQRHNHVAKILHQELAIKFSSC